MYPLPSHSYTKLSTGYPQSYPQANCQKNIKNDEKVKKVFAYLL